MEEILSMVCGLGFTVLFMAFPFGLIAWTFVRPRFWARRWVTAAQTLGLELEPFEPSHQVNFFDGSPPSIKQRMRGQRAGLDVDVGIRIVVTGSGKNRSVTYYTYARAYYGRDLAMGLGVRPVGLLGRLWNDVAGTSDITMGDAQVDAHHQIQGLDEAHVRALLSVPYVAESLRASVGAAFGAHVSDTEVRFERATRELDAPMLGFALDRAVDLARRVLAAHEQLGPSDTERAIEDAMRAVAARHGLVYDANRRLLSGRVQAMHVEVDAQVRGHQRWTQLTTRFDRPLGLRLRLTRQGALSGVGKLLGMQDIEVGDPLFDARFVVKGAPENAVRAVLTREVCARLATLQQQCAALTVEDDHVSAEIGFPIAQADDIERAVLAMAQVGAAMCGVTPNRAGPFRS